MNSPYESPGVKDIPKVSSENAQVIRGLQLVTIFMIVGVLVAAGVVLSWNQGVPGNDPDILSWIGIGLACVMLVNRFIVVSIVTRTGLGRIDAGQVQSADEQTKFELLFPVFRAGHLISCAILEGAAVLNLMIYMTTEYFGNIVAAGILTLVMVSMLISASSTAFWVRNRVEEFESM